MSLELLTYKKQNGAVVDAAIITAKYAGVTLATTEIAAKDLNAPAFLSKSPFGKVPALKTVSGPIYDAAAILKNIASSRADLTLTGASFYEKSIVDQWVNIAVSEVPALLATMASGNDGEKTNSLKKILTFFKVVNEHLVYHTFIAGNTFTIADIVLATTLVPAFTSYFGKLAQSTIPAVTRWFVTVVNQPLVAAVVGTVELATEDVFIKPEVDTAALAAAPPKPVKVVNKLDELPKTELKLDDVKRSFGLTRPFNPEFFPAFWETFDYEGYSLWAAEYKYPEDWDKDYVADNQVSGFINRSDAARKYAFGVLNIYKQDDGNFQAKGAYIMRGLEMIDEIGLVGDFDEYNFTKIDAKSAEGKALFEKLFTAHDVDGHEIVYRKQLK